MGRGDKKFYNDKQFKVESELGVVFKDYLEYSYENILL